MSLKLITRGGHDWKAGWRMALERLAALVEGLE